MKHINQGLQSVKYQLTPPGWLRFLFPSSFYPVDVSIDLATLNAGQCSVPNGDILDAIVSPRFFWTRAELSIQGKTAPILIGRLTSFDAKAFASSVNAVKDGIQLVNLGLPLQTFLGANQYRSRSETRQLLASLEPQKLNRPVINQDTPIPGCLSEEYRLLSLDNERFYELLNESNTTFVERQKTTHQDFFNSIEQLPLTGKQQEAAIRNEDSNLIVAGAGTGKTACVIARIGYLLKEGLANPDQILVLAYGKKAQEELESRVAKSLGNIDLTVKTFHGLGLTICAQSSGKKPSLSRLAEDDQTMVRLIDETIAQGLSDPARRDVFLKFMAFYRNEIIDEWDFNSKEEYHRKLAQTDLRTLSDGIKVKSHQELQIANWLTLNGIQYKYEKPYPFNTSSTSYRQYKPDFYLPEYNLYLEHFGVNEKGDTAPGVDRQDYLESMSWKRELHAEHGTRLIETYSFQFHKGTWARDLKNVLEQHEVQFHKANIEDVLNHLRESGKQSTVAKFFKNYIDLLKTTDVSFENLNAKSNMETGTSLRRAKAFIPVLQHVWNVYHEALTKTSEIDFGDMIQKAIELVATQSYRSPYTHIIVDEFQDISRSRGRLLQALIKNNSNVRLFCVGDDWQSIYRFAGSDVQIMSNFDDHFGHFSRTDLDQTFRYSQNLLNASSRFVLANPIQLKKELRSNVQLISKPIEINFIKKYETDEKSGASLRDQWARIYQKISRENPKRETNVLVLGRYNHNKDQIPSFFLQPQPNIKTTFHTAHKAKGLEADYVILLEVNRGKYGFPTDIVDDPLIALVLGKTDSYPNSEERRLFYVALTRARRNVYIFATESNRSSFVDELLTRKYSREVDRPNMEFEDSNCPECGGHIVQRHGRHGTFWSCEFFPICDGKLTVCQECGAGAIEIRGDSGECNLITCNARYSSCPRHGCNGVLLHRTGKYGQFLGCSNYPACERTKNMD